MQGVDLARSESLCAALGDAEVVPGGSAANSAVGAAMLGVPSRFIGKVGDDGLGRLFVETTVSAGVTFDVPPDETGLGTARCVVAVTPDGERTMSTYLGACQALPAHEIDHNGIAGARLLYLEGYFFEPGPARAASLSAIRTAREAGTTVALTLSDPACADRYRQDFLSLLHDGLIDLLFANQHEVRGLYATEDEDTAIQALRSEGVIGVVTRSAEGAVVLTKGSTTAVPAHPVHRLVDTTGAGDGFAAGFLVGLARQFAWVDCARLGCFVAADVVGRTGARPGSDLRASARKAGFVV